MKESVVAAVVLMLRSRTLLNPIGGKNPESVEVAAEAVAGTGRIGRRSDMLAVEATQRVPAVQHGNNLFLVKPCLDQIITTGL
jgi:hypothetical protein